MFFKKNNEKVLEKPLGYWEEKSYMMVLLADDKGISPNTIFSKVTNVDGLKLVETKNPEGDNPGIIKLVYDGEDYELGFYMTDFSMSNPRAYMNQSYYFLYNEIEKIKSTSKALTIFMNFNDEPKKSYHLQLKIAVSIVPNLVGIMDESAEKLLPPIWVQMAASSNVTPSPNDLYTVQAVTSEDGEVWLHTHGLCRCGLTELEILKSDRENYTNHYHLISTFASYLIDNKKTYNLENDSAYIGLLSNREPVVVTCVPWTKGLKEYKKLKLGSIKDRQNGHNSKTSLIFIYKSEEDEIEKKLSKVTDYNNLWGDNPIFFISNEETARMKALAMERFDFVKKEAKKKEEIIIKIALKVDDDNFEHIWFELVEFKKDKFKAKLLQEPYDVKDIKVGDERWFTVEDVTDWIIYKEELNVTPSNAYLLVEK